jgi:hypothetical protein
MCNHRIPRSHLTALNYGISIKIAIASQLSQKPPLTTTNLVSRNWLDPNKHQVHDNHHYANNPEDLGIIGTMISEDNRVNDTTEVAYSADSAGENTLG